MKHRIGAVAGALAASVLLAACGGNNNATNTGNTALDVNATDVKCDGTLKDAVKNGSAEVAEIKIDRKGVALRGDHVNDGGARSKVFGVEIELESGAGEFAAPFIGTKNVRLARRRERPEVLVFAGNLNVKVFPEVIRTGDEAGGRTRARTCGANDVSAIGVGELDLHDDPYEFGLIAMIECRLLGAVTRGVLARLLDEQSEGSEESDRGDVRTGFRRL